MRRWKSRILYILFLIVFLAVAGEITVRIMGYHAWKPADQSFVVEPGGRLFEEDSQIGFVGRPGSFQITLDERLHYEATHAEDGFRIHYQDTVPDKPQTWMMGCSFTYGFGVSDTTNYPWILGKLMPKYEFRNYSMPGYGTLQSLLLLQRLLESGRRPHTVVLAYGSFHDQRNTSNRIWRKVLAGREVAEDLRYPHIRYDANDSLKIGYSRLEYAPFPGARWSALMHFIEKKYNNAEDRKLRSYDITRTLIQRIAATCEAHGIRFILAGIYRHPGTTSMLGEFADKGIPTIDISPDTDDPALRILPDDGHPNARAHRQMAQMMADFLLSLEP